MLEKAIENPLDCKEIQSVHSKDQPWWDDLGEWHCNMYVSCKNRIASLCPTQDTACLGLVHGDYGKGGGRGVHVWERMYTRGGFMSMYGKTNIVL